MLVKQLFLLILFTTSFNNLMASTVPQKTQEHSTTHKTPINWNDEDLFTCSWPTDESIETEKASPKKTDATQKTSNPKNMAQSISSKDAISRVPSPHVDISTINLALPPRNGQAHTDFVDFFDNYPPALVSVVLTILPYKTDTKTFKTNIKKISNLLFNSSLEKRIITQAIKAKQNNAPLTSVQENEIPRIIIKNLKKYLSPMIKFLEKNSLQFKAVSTIDTGEETLESFSHKEHEPLAQSLLICVQCDKIQERSLDSLKTSANIAELPAILSEHETSECSCKYDKFPKPSPVMEEVFKRENVLDFLQNLRISDDYCLTVGIRTPTE